MGVDAVEELMLEPNDHDEKIYVSVRVRPLNEKEKARNDVSDWECINDDTVLYRNPFQAPERSLYPTAYTFDKVFRCSCSTRQVYEEGAKEVALSVVSGINSSVFAYGQTSSGKTYTMCGVTEFTVADVYDYMDKHKEREFILKFSAMEIYNESVRDLLSADSTPLRLLDDPERGTTVEKLTEETLRDWNHFKELLSVCESQRQIGDTSLNETSSRSHQILRLTVESSTREFLSNGNASTLTATVNLVDLAGSERASQALSAGTRLKEGCHINRSLLTLGTVIRKLSKGRTGHIPFRDSKLTRILQSTLGGNARTAIICTMSPARSHVEQSRNTLLFASCAKEVSTNAQVNVVMSDKALVKHLQRELARLESELRSQGPTFVASDSAALLRGKDAEIEKLRKELKEVTLQRELLALEQQQLVLDRDIAQSQLKDLLQIVETSRLSAVSADDDTQYPNLHDDHQYPQLRVRERAPASIESQSVDLGVRSFDASQYSDRHSWSNSEDNYHQFSDMDESFQHEDMSHSPSFSIPTYIQTHTPLGETEEQTDMNSDDLCKEVRCIETEESSENGYAESVLSYSEKKMAISVVTEVDDGDEVNQEREPPSFKDDKEEDISCVSVIKSPDRRSPWYPEREMSSCRSLKITRSQSCRASFMTCSLSHWTERGENIENSQPYGYEKDITERPETFQRKPAAVMYVVDNENLERNSSPASVKSAVVDDLEMQNAETSCNAKCGNCSTSAKVTDESSEFHNEDRVADHEVHETKQKCTKDVGLDPIPSNSKNLSNWPLEFERLQREMIELWSACNVSLVHRTYFFLQCQGDPKDSIYMELELRRLSTLKNSLSSADRAQRHSNPMSSLVSTIAGRIIRKGELKLSSTTNNKALCRERRWLSKRMKKMLSGSDRESLYLKWDIGMDTRDRKLQLAYRLWTDVGDMRHVTESANVVAKLVPNVQPEVDFREMVRLYFAPPRRSSWKFYQWRN